MNVTSEALAKYKSFMNDTLDLSESELQLLIRALREEGFFNEAYIINLYRVVNH